MLDEETIVGELEDGDDVGTLRRMAEEGFPQTRKVFDAVLELACGSGPEWKARGQGGITGELVDIMNLVSDRSMTAYFNEAIGTEVDIVRFLSSVALAKIGDESSVFPLLGALFDDYSWTVSYSAEALGNIGDRRAVFALMEVVRHFRDYPDDDDWNDASDSAITALGKLGDERALPALLEFDYTGGMMPLNVAKALGMIGHPSAIPALAKELRKRPNSWEENRDTRKDIESALERCRGASPKEGGLMLDAKIKPPKIANEKRKIRI
ncbi:MAG: hypothetical protein AB1324_06010 [Candidatus Micrarchaeota archaeon]